VGCCGAARALDRGWEAAAVAIDGEEKLRRGFGEVESSGRRKVGKMGVCKCKSEFTRSSRTCFKLRKRHGEPEQVLASRRHAWRLGRRCRDVEERGEGQRGVGSGGAGAGAARGAKGSGAGAAGARHMAGKGGGGHGREAEQGEGLEVEDKG
jgi:hypothetical protein